MTRRILICTIGSTPQIVTETVWALLEKKPPWKPDDIEVVTTAFALQRASEALQRADGPLAKLMGRPPPVIIFVPRDDDTADIIPAGSTEPVVSDRALTDVNSERQAALMGNLIFRRIARAALAKGEDETEMHVSLAGGRKTMSAHALMALSLVGRPRDRASHVLVSPAEFEDNSEFWHPAQGGLIHTRDDAHKVPRPPPRLDPADAKVLLVPTPHLMVRRDADDLEKLKTLSLVDAVNRANLAEALRLEPLIELDAGQNEIALCGLRARFSPKMFALFRLLCAARAQGWGLANSDGGAGMLTAKYVLEGRLPSGEPIYEFWRRCLQEAVVAVGGDSEDHENRVFQGLNKTLGGKDPGWRIDEMRGDLAPALNRLRKDLGDAFGSAAAELILPRQKRGDPFGLSAPTQSIVIR